MKPWPIEINGSFAIDLPMPLDLTVCGGGSQEPHAGTGKSTSTLPQRLPLGQGATLSAGAGVCVHPACSHSTISGSSPVLRLPKIAQSPISCKTPRATGEPSVREPMGMRDIGQPSERSQDCASPLQLAEHGEKGGSWFMWTEVAKQ